MNRPALRVAYLTWHDPQDLRHWSGTHAFMFDALSRHVGEVIPCGPFATPRFYRALELVANAWHRGPAARKPKKYRLGYSWLAAFAYGIPARRRIVAARPDIIFAPAAAREACFASSGYPLVYLNDAIFSQTVALYPRFQNHAPLTYREAEGIERRCVRRAAACVFSSSWAADAAQARYGASPDRLHVVPFGANLSGLTTSAILRQRKVGDPMRLLLVGKQWHRKGVDIAIEAVRLVRETGRLASLTVLGCSDAPAGNRPDWVEMIPFLDKSSPSGGEAYRRLLAERDLFILPTRADCWGIVLNEAAAFGLPALTSDCGGIREVVLPDRTGYVHSGEAHPQDYADSIIRLMEDPALYQRLSQGARQDYEARLNWDVWGLRLRDIMQAISVR